MVINHTLSLVEEWLNSDECPVSRQLDMGSARELVSLLISFLGPKANVLSQQSLQHLSTLILKVWYVLFGLMLLYLMICCAGIFASCSK